MNSIEIKSTGTLVDELHTLDLKIDAGMDTEDMYERRHVLANIVIARSAILVHDMPKYREFQNLTRELKEVLTRCWDAQEIVSKTPITNYTGKATAVELHQNLDRVAKYAKIAQETNAQRNRLIRQLDTLLNEMDRTQLRKTYDKEI